MSQKSPASVPASGVPGTGGSGPYIGLAGVLLVVLSGLLCWKFKGNEAPQPAPIPSAPEVVQRPRMDAPPPPPDDKIPEATVSGTKAKPGPGGGGYGCSAGCTGTPAAGMRGELSSRAGSARGCYERALRSNSMLQGKIVLALKIDNTGVVCSAGVASDGIGSGDVTSCVVGMFRGMKVSAPTGGCVDATLPLNFQPKK